VPVAAPVVLRTALVAAAVATALSAANPTGVSGAATGSGAAAGAASLRQSVGGAAAGAGNAAGTATLRQAVGGAASGAGAAEGAVATATGISGAASGSGAAAGALALRQSIAGLATGDGAASGSVFALASISGAATGAGAAAGAVTLRQVVAGGAAGEGEAAGALALRQTIAGAAAGVGAASGAVSAIASISGSAAGEGVAAGAVSLRQSVAGAAAAPGSASGALALRQSLAGAASGAGTAAGAVAAGGDTLEFGDETLPGTPLTTVTLARTLTGIGDSRMLGNWGGQFYAEVLLSCGGWVIANRALNSNFFGNYGVGGDGLAEMIAQATAAAATASRVHLVLGGVNGAGDAITDNLANRQAQLTLVLQELDQAGAVIFLCNEMPNNAPDTDTDALHVSYHDWLDTVDATTFSLSDADLVVVDTWSAVADPDFPLRLDPRWEADGLHPHNQGQERMARAVYEAMAGYFTQPLFDLSAPDQNWMDGTTTVSVNRGTLPAGWLDFSAADDLDYVTSGTGLATQIDVENNSASPKGMVTRYTPAAVTDGLVYWEYYLPPEPAADRATLSRTDENTCGFRNFSLGTGANIGVGPSMFPADSSLTRREQELGGWRRVTMYVEASATSPRFDVSSDISAGKTITLRRALLYEL